MNNTDALLHQVINDLPNFPRNIIDVWIFPYSKMKGWPPDIQDSNSGWNYVLLKKDLDYWKNVTWHSKLTSIDDIPFSNETLKTIMSVHLMIQNKDSKRRVDRIVESLQTIGTFPQPPVFINLDGEFTIADGHHRLFAYLACRRSILKLNIENYLKEKHIIWVGTPQPLPFEQ